MFSGRQFFVVIFFVACTFITLQASQVVTKEESLQPNLFEKISQIHMRIYPDENYSWTEDDYAAFLRRYTDMCLNPKPSWKPGTALFFLKKATEKSTVIDHKKISYASVWQDLNFFAGKNYSQEFLAKAIDRTITNIGKMSLFGLLSSPIADQSYLEKRQHIIKTFINDPKNLSLLREIFKTAAPSEYLFLSYWKDEHFRHDIKHALYSLPLLREFNDDETALLASSTWMHTMSSSQSITAAFASAFLLMYGLAEFFNFSDMKDSLQKKADENIAMGSPLFPYAWKISNRWIHASVALMASFCCAWLAKILFEQEKNNIISENCFQTFLIHVATYATSLEKAYDIIKNNPELRNFEEFKDISTFFETIVPKTEELAHALDLFKKDTFKGEPSMLSHKGNILVAYSLFLNIKESFESVVAAVGRLEAYTSLATLYKEFEGKDTTFSFASYQQNETPFVIAEEFWHPQIDPKKVVRNSMTLGTHGERSNVVLTGPNEGGKSTILKSMAICVFLAQTIGIVPAKQFTLTPFESISTYLNITDDIAAGNSHFKSEVLRARVLIKNIQDLGTNKFSFAIFDEVFNGTSPKEGEAAAYSVTKYAGAFPNAITLVATHFSMLTDLEFQTDRFTNYRVSVVKHPNRIEYPYKLERGSSDQHVALDILRDEGFTDEILDEATRIVAGI